MFPTQTQSYRYKIATYIMRRIRTFNESVFYLIQSTKATNSGVISNETTLPISMSCSIGA